jgi:isopenicillin-N N-acyltransferase like protein
LCVVGVAEGAEVAFEDILAMNVRSEISMGMTNDECTALYWGSPSAAVLGQNWDVRRSSSLFWCLHGLE